MAAVARHIKSGDTDRSTSRNELREAHRGKGKLLEKREPSEILDQPNAGGSTAALPLRARLRFVFTALRVTDVSTQKKPGGKSSTLLTTLIGAAAHG